MNILLINHYAGSDNHGMEYRPYYFAKEWQKAGHNVTIVASSYSHLRSKNPTIKKKINVEIIDGINYIWLKTNEYKGNGLGRIINMLTFIFRLYCFKSTIIKKYKPNVIIASSTYPLDIFPSSSIARKTKSKLIFEVHDLWPLSPIELGRMSKYNPFIIIMQIAENYAYKNCHKTVSLLPKANDYMMKHGLKPNKFEYISNGINLNEWTNNNSTLPELHLKTLNELKSNNRFLVAYTGAHGIANALHSFIEAANIINNSDVAFILVGQGTEKEALKNKAKELKLNNTTFLPSVPKASMQALLGFMDVLYIGLKNEPLFRFGISPNKLLDYMMSAKPVIQAINAGNDIVTDCNCGITIPPEEPKAIVEAIIMIKNMSIEERANMGNNGHNYIIKMHDYKVLAKRFEDVMK